MSCWARVVPWAVISFSGAGQSVRLSKQGSGVGVRCPDRSPHRLLRGLLLRGRLSRGRLFRSRLFRSLLFRHRLLRQEGWLRAFPEILPQAFPPYYNNRAHACVRRRDAVHPAYQVYPWERPAAASLRAGAHVAQFGQVEGGAYVDAVVVCFQGVAEELVCRVHIVFVERLHSIRKSLRPASPQSVAMANASCTYSL